jgi:hypothetical protein
MIYLYAIIDRPAVPLSDIPGLEGAVIDVLSYQNIGAVISPSRTSEVPPTEANLWQHEAALEALMDDRSVLPVRFGTVLADEPAVQAALVAHYGEFTANLNRVRGHVELGLRVLWDHNDVLSLTPDARSQTPSGNGLAYMSARLEEERKLEVRRQRAEVLAEGIHMPLARLAAESTRRMLITPRSLVAAAYLVERERVAGFRQEVEVLSSTHPELRFLCTGPWPPFSFVAMSNEQ